MPCTPSAWTIPRVGVGVDLGQDHLAVAVGDGLFQDGSQRLARAAPLGPHVDDDRHLPGAIDHLGLETGFIDVDDMGGTGHVVS
jgi:hypothetical protein